jgi:hypothetical protein
MPDYWSLGEVLSDMADFLFDSLVFIATGGFLFLWLHMVEEGLEMLCELANDAAEIVKDAVDVIVDAFSAFVEWVIDYICDAFTALIAQPLQRIYDSIESWATGLVSLVKNASDNIESGSMDNDTASIPTHKYIVDSEILNLLIVIGISLFAVITAASFLGPFGALTAILISALINILIVGELTSAAISFSGVGDVAIWVMEIIYKSLGSDIIGGMAGIMGATSGTIGWLVAQVVCPVNAGFKAFFDFAIATMGALLSWVACNTDDWTSSFILACIGVGFSVYGFCDLLFDTKSIIAKTNPTANEILIGISMIDVGTSVFGFGTTVANYGE